MDVLFTAMPQALRFFIAFLVVLALIGLTAWLVRRFGANRLGGAARGRQPRLAVIDAANVDGRRRLVLIRRDNTEHLLMIGGPTDVVIEPNIVRATGARETAREPVREPARINFGSEPPARAEPSWQPPAAEPSPPMPPPVAPMQAPRSYRAPATEEPWLPPEPGGRARPADSLTGLAAELSAKLNPPDLAPPPARAEPPLARAEPPPPRTVAPPVTPVMPEPPTAPQDDHNLAEMAQQLEAALRRAPAPEGRPPVTDALAVPPSGKPAQRGAPRDFNPRAEPKFESAKFEAPKFDSPKFEQPKFEPPKFDGPKFEPKFETKFETKFEQKREPKLEPPERKPEPKFNMRPEQKPEAASSAPDKNLYDNLEEEMASLLGRPSDKT
jgi:hypothetical protein